MTNQFFYTRIFKDGDKETPFLDSFNTDLVIRTIETHEKGRLVVLNDFHEETRQVPILNNQKKITGYKNQKDTFQSEIELLPDDAKRFVEQFNK